MPTVGRSGTSLGSLINMSSTATYSAVARVSRSAFTWSCGLGEVSYAYPGTSRATDVETAVVPRKTLGRSRGRTKGSKEKKEQIAEKEE